MNLVLFFDINFPFRDKCLRLNKDYIELKESEWLFILF